MFSRPCNVREPHDWYDMDWFTKCNFHPTGNGCLQVLLNLQRNRQALTLESWYCPVPDSRLSLSMRYHCHGTRAILFSCTRGWGKRNEWIYTRDVPNEGADMLKVAQVSISVRALLTFPPFVNLWMPAVATPGMIRHAVMMAKPGRISYHMVSASNCRATKSNF